MYDTCVTLEKSEKPWCSLKTDLNNNHVDGEENIGTCQDQCNVQNCPIGFFFLTGNCYLMSARVPSDLVTSTEEAENLCLEKGARLYQPRDYALTEEFLKWEEDYLKPAPDFHFKYRDDLERSSIALGAYQDYDGGKGGLIMYNDKTRAYYLESLEEDQGGSISKVSNSYTGKACISFTISGKIKATVCEDFTNSKEPVGYICEARIIHTIEGPSTGKVCQLPFTLDGSINYHSCVYNQTARYSWCPTKLGLNGEILPENVGNCPDEREITYKGPGSGKMCNFPFLHNRVWYDTCAFLPKPELWCPTILNPTRMFDEAVDEFGYCTKYFSSGADCSENYSPVDGKCIRVSPFPETFDAASAKCDSEGAQLLSIHDDATIPPIKAHIAQNKENKVQYLPEFSPDLSAYWVGGVVNNYLWTWISSGKNFTAYSNWMEGKENEGCVQYTCTDNYALTIQAGSNFVWKATDRSVEKPYICEAICKQGFIWYKTTKKCIRSQYMTKDHLTHSKAMLSCSLKGARMAKFETCDQFNGLVQDLAKSYPEEEQVYALGAYHLGIDYYAGKRISVDTRSTRGVIRSDGYSGILNCPELPDSTGTSPEIGILSIDSTGTATVSYNARDSDDKHGLLCEQESDWSCPESYVLFLEHCYKVFNDSKPFNTAKATCLQEKGQLFELFADLHFMFLLEFLDHIGISDPVWTAIRKDPADLTDSPDVNFNAYNLKKRTFDISSGKFIL